AAAWARARSPTYRSVPPTRGSNRRTTCSTRMGLRYVAKPAAETSHRASSADQAPGRGPNAVSTEKPARQAVGRLVRSDDGPALGVAVNADHRRGGYGRQMMVWLGEEARRRGADRIRLRVHEDNRAARDLYSALGYVVTGEERGELVMVLELAAR